MILAKKMITEEVADYLQQVAANYSENWKGNATLRDFSDQYEVEVKIAKKLTFDEKLQVAKSKIDECIKRWSKGSGKKIKTLVNRAFKVDNKGDVDVKTVLSLKKLDFEDDLWNEAMEIISDSVKTQATKTYYNFRYRAKDGSFKPIILNFSSLEL